MHATKTADPVLENWRLIGDGGPRTLVGEVSGHPKLDDGWITTSVAVEMAADRSWAITRARRYVLGRQLPDDKLPPQDGTDAILNRLFRNHGPASLGRLKELAPYAQELSKAPGAPSS